MLTEMAGPTVVEFPSRWVVRGRGCPRGESLQELADMAGRFQKGTEGITGLYLRMAGHIRFYEMTAAEVRPILRGAGYPESRISEILRVAYAPENVWREYSARLVGFRIALAKTRMYYEVHRDRARNERRNLRRMAGRMVERVKRLEGQVWEFRTGGFEILVRPELNITNKTSNISATGTVELPGVKGDCPGTGQAGQDNCPGIRHSNVKDSMA